MCDIDLNLSKWYLDFFLRNISYKCPVNNRALITPTTNEERGEGGDLFWKVEGNGSSSDVRSE